MIFVNCGGELDSYKSKKDVMDFFEDCIYCSEGSERDRYTEIYFSIKENLNTKQRCFTDGTEYVYKANIKDSELSESDKAMINNYYHIDVDKLLNNNEPEI